MIKPNPGYEIENQAYSFTGGIMDIENIGETTLINELMPSISQPLSSNLAKKVFSTNTED